jgi:hypothetical protein
MLSIFQYILISILNNVEIAEFKKVNNSLEINTKLYLLNEFDSNNNTCIKKFEFSYDSHDLLENIHFGQVNFNNNLVLAVKNHKTLIALSYYDNEKRFNEFTINVRKKNY